MTFNQMARNLSYFTTLKLLNHGCYQATLSYHIPGYDTNCPQDGARGMGGSNDLFTCAVKQTLNANKCIVRPSTMYFS